MGIIGLLEIWQVIVLLWEFQLVMIYIDVLVLGIKVFVEKVQILVFVSGDREKGVVVELVFVVIFCGMQWFGEVGNSQKMKLVFNVWLILMMQGIVESVQLVKMLGFIFDQLWSVLEGGLLVVFYVKVKLDVIVSEQFILQMQLVYVLKDVWLVFFLVELYIMLGLENIVELWQQVVDVGYVGEDLFVVYQWLLLLLKVQFFIYVRKEVVIVVIYSGGWGINLNLLYVSLSY